MKIPFENVLLQKLLYRQKIYKIQLPYNGVWKWGENVFPTHQRLLNKKSSTKYELPFLELLTNVITHTLNTHTLKQNTLGYCHATVTLRILAFLSFFFLKEILSHTIHLYHSFSSPSSNQSPPLYRPLSQIHSPSVSTSEESRPPGDEEQTGQNKIQ